MRGRLNQLLGIERNEAMNDNPVDAAEMTAATVAVEMRRAMNTFKAAEALFDRKVLGSYNMGCLGQRGHDHSDRSVSRPVFFVGNGFPAAWEGTFNER
ncbi:MAG: hypothetical protein U9R25_10615 [Chloroflexota bacterium]|nr:hypothetical protein [Chloroflexota bacterium]